MDQPKGIYENLYQLEVKIKENVQKNLEIVATNFDIEKKLFDT